MKIRPAVTTTTAVLGLLAAALASTATGAVASSPGSHHKIQRLVVLQPKYDEGVRPDISRSGGASKGAAPSIPLFHSTVTDGATTFPYTMVGKNPFVAHANVVHVTANRDVWPDAGALADNHVANNLRTGIDVSGGCYARHYPAVGSDQLFLDILASASSVRRRMSSESLWISSARRAS